LLKLYQQCNNRDARDEKQQKRQRRTSAIRLSLALLRQRVVFMRHQSAMNPCALDQQQEGGVVFAIVGADV